MNKALPSSAYYLIQFYYDMNMRLRGFTLIELMIVVAIIGVLAAVAVPGYKKFIKHSKTAEAVDQLNAITKGASAYYQTEHCLNTICTQLDTHYYPGCESAVNAPYSECAKESLIPGGLTGVGIKYSPLSVVNVVNVAPWDRLKFQMVSPFYYDYYYSSKAPTKTDDSLPINAEFCAGAEASLSGERDSTYQVIGSNGAIGSIIDKSDETTSGTKVTCGSGS